MYILYLFFSSFSLSLYIYIYIYIWGLTQAGFCLCRLGLVDSGSSLAWILGVRIGSPLRTGNQDLDPAFPNARGIAALTVPLPGAVR